MSAIAVIQRLIHDREVRSRSTQNILLPFFDCIHTECFKLISVLRSFKLSLFDGTQLVSWDHWKYLLAQHSEEELHRMRIFPVHPSFRVLAVGGFPTSDNKWLTEEVMHMFTFHTMPELSHADATQLIQKKLQAKNIRTGGIRDSRESRKVASLHCEQLFEANIGVKKFFTGQ